MAGRVDLGDLFRYRTWGDRTSERTAYPTDIGPLNRPPELPTFGTEDDDRSSGHFEPGVLGPRVDDHPWHDVETASPASTFL